MTSVELASRIGPRFLQGDFVPGHVKHELPFFSAPILLPVNGAFDKGAAPAALHPNRRQLRIECGANCWMRKHECGRGPQGRRHLPNGRREARRSVRHENSGCNHTSRPAQPARPPRNFGTGPRISVPGRNTSKTLTTQIFFCEPRLPMIPSPNYTDIFSWFDAPI